jgi:hypothetical protein
MICRQGRLGLPYTYNINTPVSRNSDHGVEGTEIDTNDAHLCFVLFVAGRSVRCRVELSKCDFCEKKRRREMWFEADFFQSIGEYAGEKK